jgi:peptide/nickel transport system substrate-binding protein
MDYSGLDKVRRSTTPLQLDTVESFARGRLSRREFIKSGTIVGLSMASISAVIAACGGTTTPSASGAAPSAAASAGASAAPPSAAVTGGTIRCAVQRPVSVDPVAMQDLGGYGITAQSFEFHSTQQTIGDPGGLAPGLAE